MQLVSAQLDAVAFKKTMQHLMQLGSPQAGNLLAQSAYLRENQVLLEALFLLTSGRRVPGLSRQTRAASANNPQSCPIPTRG